MTSAYLTGPFSRILLRARIRVTPAAIVTGAQRVGIASARLNAVGEASATRAAPHSGAADHEHRLRASCQTVGTAAECVVTVRVISSLRVSVALKLCG